MFAFLYYTTAVPDVFRRKNDIFGIKMKTNLYGAFFSYKTLNILFVFFFCFSRCGVIAFPFVFIETTQKGQMEIEKNTLKWSWPKKSHIVFIRVSTDQMSRITYMFFYRFVLVICYYYSDVDCLQVFFFFVV